jgi:hypothetical protein
METSTTTAREGLAERMELLGSMGDEDARLALAFVAEYAPAVFDAAVARLVDAGAEDQGDDDGQGDDLEPYCAACGASIGVFIAHGNAYLHYRGAGTVASPIGLYDAGHEPVIAWRAAVSR